MRFEYADDRMPFAMTQGGSTYYMTYDQVGSLRLVADAVGNVVKEIEYDSFGNIINDTNPGFVVPFGFAGGLHDRDTGLVRFGFRDYDPDIGRWTAKDPIFFVGGDTDLYGYCLNDPVKNIDYLGLQLGEIINKASTIWTVVSGAGPGTITGSLIGGAIGGMFGGITGAVAGGLVGGSLGSAFDNPADGKPNYGEERMLEHYLTMKEADRLLKEWQELGKEVDELCRRTGGCNHDITPCP